MINICYDHEYFLLNILKSDLSSQVSKGLSVEFSAWHSDKFRSGHLRHIGRGMEWREK